MAMNYTLRSLTAADEPFLWEMLYQIICQALSLMPDSMNPSRALLRYPEVACYVENWGGAGDAGWLVSDAEGQPVGAVWLRFLGRAGHGYVDDATPELAIAVVPAHRGQGVGTQLLTTLLASDSGRLPISLSVLSDNPVRRLYTRCGFTVVSEKAGVLTMRRAISG